MLIDKLNSNPGLRSAAMHKMNPARVDREDERKMLPCRAFLDGFCPRGHRCRFYHPIPSSLPTVIRVPNLPSSFQQCHFGQYPVHGGHHSLFNLSPTSSRSYGLSPKLGNGLMGSLGTPGSSSNSGRYGSNGFSHGGRVTNIPLSPTYSEYEIAYAQEMEIQKEKERRAAAPPQDPDEIVQNTVFSHIDWKEFLTPGSRPPPPTHVPFMGNSPGKVPSGEMDSLETFIRSAGSTKIASPVNLTKSSLFDSHLDVSSHADYTDPVMDFFSEKIENSDLSVEPFHACPKPVVNATKDETIYPSSKGLSAKEELQLKVKQIAQELANEPAQHVQSLDTFFRNYTFQSMPTPPSSEQDLVGASSPSPGSALLQAIPELDSDKSINEDVQDEASSISNSEFDPNIAAFSSSSHSGLSSSNGSGNSASSVESDISPATCTSSHAPLPIELS